MDETPLISVVMPVYNGGATVLAAVNSILGQTYRNFELIAVDDRSTDGTMRVLESVRDPRLKILSHPERRGVGAIRRFGTEHAKGDYIAVQDADDISFPDRLGTQLEYMRLNSLKLCGTWAWLVEKDGARSEFRHPSDPDTIRRRIIATNCFVNTTVMFEKCAYEAVGGYDPSPRMSYVEDYDLWLRLVSKYRAGNVPRILAEYAAPKDDFKYLWREQTRTASARLRAVFRYGYPVYNLVFAVTPLVSAFIPKKAKLFARRLWIRG